MKGMRAYFDRVRQYYRDNEKGIIEFNWKQLRKMTVLYLSVLILYYAVSFIVPGQALFAPRILAAIIIQIVFTACIWMMKKPPSSRKKTDAILALFGLLIMALAFLHDIVTFPDQNAWVFPPILIMLTQFYDMDPLYKSIEITGYMALFVILSFLMRPMDIACLDLMSFFCAYSIAMTSTFTLLWYRMTVFENRVQLQKLCTVDQSTGVLNKNTFEYYYDEFRRSHQKGTYALAILDIDDFKSVNDNYGHLKGDQALKLLVSIMQKSFPDSAEVEKGRFGGDEFVILVKQVLDRPAIEQRFRTMQEDFSGAVPAQLSFPLSFSLGVAFSQEMNVPFDTLFEAADQALYKAKDEGGQKILFTTQGRDSR